MLGVFNFIALFYKITVLEINFIKLLKNYITSKKKIKNYIFL